MQDWARLLQGVDLKGLMVFESPLCVEVVTVWKVQKVPIAKRRKRWRVVPKKERQGTCWMIGPQLFAHPSVIAQLKAHGALEANRETPYMGI